jgi:hypothetical protein
MSRPRCPGRRWRRIPRRGRPCEGGAGRLGHLPLRERVRRIRRIPRIAGPGAWPRARRGAHARGRQERERGPHERGAPQPELFDDWAKDAPQFLAREKVPLDPLNFPRKRGFIAGRADRRAGPRHPVELTRRRSPCARAVARALAGNGVVWEP